jgi:hypothetical protein
VDKFVIPVAKTPYKTVILAQFAASFFKVKIS